MGNVPTLKPRDVEGLLQALGSRIRACAAACNRHGLTITVAHYPPGASKWNPIEHRLFSEISKNWAGPPLDSYETILKYIRRTKTSTGLRVRAQLAPKKYPKGVRITDSQLRELSLEKHESLPKWNHTLRPH